jgi:hypothetical protein
MATVREFPICEKAILTFLVSVGEGPRFAQLFQRAYAKLPKSARERIEEHWRGTSALNINIKRDVPVHFRLPK